MSPEPAARDDAPMTALQRLIREQKQDQRLSYGGIAARSGKDADGKPRISRSHVQQLAKAPIRRSPEPKTVEGLAAGLGVPLSIVKDAVSESLNLLVLRDSSDPEITVHIRKVNQLSELDRRRYLKAANALLEGFMP